MRRKRFFVRVDDGINVIGFRGRNLKDLLETIEEKYEGRRR